MEDVMISMVVFDMAGTVVDEDNVVYKSLHQAIGNAGHEVSLDIVLRDGSGKEKLQAIKDVMTVNESTHDEAEYLAIHADFKEILDKNYRYLDIKGMQDAQTVFNDLRQNSIAVALNTGYHRDMALLLIDRIGWQQGLHYDVLVTASDVAESRPHPAMIEQAMQLAEVDNPASVAKVGDSAIDIDEGKNAGCGLTFGVTTGAQTRVQLQAANPDYVVDSLTEVLEFVLQKNRSYAAP